MTAAQVQSQIKAGQSLQGAELSNIDLQQANLDHGQFEQAYLRFANLTGASCHCANFKQATLMLATLNGASFQEATFCQALLNAAHLEGTSLKSIYATGMKLTKTKLNSSDFSNAI